MSRNTKASTGNCAVRETGAARESIGTKIDTSLVPFELICAAAVGLNYGAEKYAPRNWEKGLTMTDLTNSVDRHNRALMAGEYWDEPSGLPHYVMLASCAAMLVASIHRGIAIEDRAEPAAANVSGAAETFMQIFNNRLPIASKN